MPRTGIQSKKMRRAVELTPIHASIIATSRRATLVGRAIHMIVYIVPSPLSQFALNTTQTDGSAVSLWPSPVHLYYDTVAEVGSSYAALGVFALVIHRQLNQ